MTRSSEVTLSVLDSVFRIDSEDRRMGELVRQLWEPFVTDRASEDGTSFRIRAQPRGWRLEAPPDAATSAEDPWVFAAVLRNALTRRAVIEARSLIPLHGAAVERGGAFVVLSAPPMAGKTTLLLELLARGWRLVTDDLIPLLPDGLTATPFPKPLSVRDPGLWRRSATGWQVPRWLPEPAVVGLIPSGAFPCTEAASFRPTLLVFPRFEPLAAPVMEELTPAQTVAACAENLHPVVRRTARALAAMAKLGSTTPGRALTYASTAEALNLFESALRTTEGLE